MSDEQLESLRLAGIFAGIVLICVLALIALFVFFPPWISVPLVGSLVAGGIAYFAIEEEREERRRAAERQRQEDGRSKAYVESEMRYMQTMDNLYADLARRQQRANRPYDYEIKEK